MHASHSSELQSTILFLDLKKAFKTNLCRLSKLCIMYPSSENVWQNLPDPVTAQAHKSRPLKATGIHAV